MQDRECVALLGRFLSTVPSSGATPTTALLNALRRIVVPMVRAGTMCWHAQ